MVWQTTRPQIQIEALVEVANLFGSRTRLIHFFEDGAAPSRVIPSAGPVGQFDNLAVVVCAGQFISRGQPGDAGAEDDD